MLFSLAACGSTYPPTATNEPKSLEITQNNQVTSKEDSERKVKVKVYDSYGDIRVHFLDVGQGDCSFIEFGNGETMLIDAGNAHNAADIIQYIKDLNYHAAIRGNRRVLFMQYIIDRFEGDFAICETEKMEFIEIHKSKIPVSAKEGDVLVKENNAYRISENRTAERKKCIDEKLKKLFVD